MVFAAEFAQQKCTALFQPVLWFKEGDVLFLVSDVVGFEPDVEQ